MLAIGWQIRRSALHQGMQRLECLLPEELTGFLPSLPRQSFDTTFENLQHLLDHSDALSGSAAGFRFGSLAVRRPLSFWGRSAWGATHPVGRKPLNTKTVLHRIHIANICKHIMAAGPNHDKALSYLFLANLGFQETCSTTSKIFSHDYRLQVHWLILKH